MTTRRDPLAENLRAALEAEAPEVGGDDEALLARAIDRAMASSVTAAPASTPASTPASARPLPGRARRANVRAVRYALPLAAAFIASIAMGAVYMVYRTPPPPQQHDSVTRAAPQVEPTAPAALPRPAPVPVNDGAPSISVDDLPSAAPPAASSVALREIAPPPAEAPSATAAELFRDANAARRVGDVGRSVELYKALIARHAQTPEAHAAHVSLGRLLLDKQGDASGALAQFDAYLRSASSDRALAEEARLGRALVFQRQGRHEEERRAWQELLERHSDSLYAARARERLRALASDVAPASSP